MISIACTSTHLPLQPINQHQLVTYQQGVGVSLQLLYDELSPYGTWVSYQDLGYVWIPTVSPDFYPYASDGHWVFTELGWAWYSNYVWGWVAFHYGRWLNDSSYGWMWVPDTEWGPAWVIWRGSDRYYGWAPLEPRNSISLAVSTNTSIPDNHWVFVRNGNLDKQDIFSYAENPNSNGSHIENTSIINNTLFDEQRKIIYVLGPDRNDVQRKTGYPVKQIAQQENTKPGQKLNYSELQIFKPAVQREITDKKSAPAKVEIL
jgi:hypothetical protein